MKTKLKWHDAAKKRPKKSGDYLVVADSGRVRYLHYSKAFDAFNAHDSADDARFSIPVLFWAKVKAPKVGVL